jgi:hypothetical protein
MVGAENGNSFALPMKATMASKIQVGSILMKEWPGKPQLLGLESEPCSGEWSLLKIMDGFTVDRKIHAAGWNFFFMAPEFNVSFFGTIGAEKIQKALARILAKVKPQHFNSLEVTGIVARSFLGVPYVTVSAHSRHMQQSCFLDGAAARHTSQHNAEWARG